MVVPPALPPSSFPSFYHLVIFQMAVFSKTRLPPELISMIIDLLHDSKPTLKTAALVCREWLPRARYHLFRRLYLNQFRIDSFLGLCRNPPVTLSNAVKELRIAPLDLKHQGLDMLLRWRGKQKQNLNTILPKVTTLTLFYAGLCTLGDQSQHNLFSASGYWKNTLTELKMLAVEFCNADQFFALVSSFPLLQLLELNSPELAQSDRLTQSSRQYNNSNRTLPSGLCEVILVNVRQPSFIEVLASCTTVSNLCYSYSKDLEKCETVKIVGNLLRSAKLALENFTFEMNRCNRNQNMDRIYRHLDLSTNKNLQNLDFLIDDGRSLIPFLTRLKARFNPVVDHPSLESLHVDLQEWQNLNWAQLDSILQSPYFSSLRELKYTARVRYASEDKPGPDGPAEGSETWKMMQKEVEKWRQRLPQCAKRGILCPTEEVI